MGKMLVFNTAERSTSFSTVRPVKKLDATGSLRLSNDFLGSGSVKRPSVSNLGVHGSPSKTTPKPLSPRAKAGKALTDEVVLPVLVKVCPSRIASRRKLMIG